MGVLLALVPREFAISFGVTAIVVFRLLWHISYLVVKVLLLFATLVILQRFHYSTTHLLHLTLSLSSLP